MIFIEQPYIETEGEKARLVSNIKFDDKVYKVFYEVDIKYRKYLTYEKADSFIIGILPNAIKNEESIISEAPISSELEYQLNYSLIPSLSKYKYNKKSISVKSEKESIKLPQGKAVGTGLSSGVDSFQTISSHINLKNSNYRITHVTFLNVGSHGKGKKASVLYEQRLNYAREVAEDLNLELININSNIGELFNSNFVEVHTYYSSSAILALQKLFKVYYYASGYPINEFNVNKKSAAANFDLLTFYSLSNESIKFYSSGIEKSRLDKVKEISEYEPSYRWLNVCTRSLANCGECEKCIRTQFELYSIGKLELYEEVFDLEKFYASVNSHMGYILANKNKSYNKEILDAIKENGDRISLNSYIYTAVHKFKFLMIKIYGIPNKLKKKRIVQ